MLKKKLQDIVGRIGGNVKNGDRVIWIIVILLMMFSLVAIFSATSKKAISDHISRIDIFWGQVELVIAGLVVILLCTYFSSISIFRRVSKYMYFLSLVLLVLLLSHIRIGDFIKTPLVHGVYRSIQVNGFNIQVFEVVKICMVMYLSWAIQAYEKNNFFLANTLGTHWPRQFGWMKSAAAQRWIYIFVPMMLVTVLILPGSTGSAILTALVMLATILIGGIKVKDLIKPGLVALACICIIVGAHILSSGRVMHRMQTFFSRMKIELPYPDKNARDSLKMKIDAKKADPDTLKPGTKAFEDYLEEIRQPRGAEIAFVEGARHVMGKGPGKSSQKYIVPIIFEDYMFSFIIEEYGMIAGIVILFMYMSLFARSTILVSACRRNRYAKACVGGLAFLITFQAMFHILINCNVGILSGQTLPLISHGRCSFLCFCFAFGVILCISKISREAILKQQEEESRLLMEEQKKDEVQSSLEIVESIDEQLEQLQENNEQNIE